MTGAPASLAPNRAVNRLGPGGAPTAPATGGPITLTVTTGRSGSSALARSFQESLGLTSFGAAEGDHVRSDAPVTHELLTVRQATPAQFHRAFGGARLEAMAAHAPAAEATARFIRLAERGPVVDFGWTMSPLVPLVQRAAPDRLRVIVLYRHPVAAAASMAVLGLYSRYPRPDEYALSPRHEGARFAGYARGWERMSEFEKCLYRWLEITAYGCEIAERLPQTPLLFVNSDLMFKDAAALGEIADFCGFAPERIRPSAFRNEKRRQNIETNPVGDEWRRYARFDEMRALAGGLGFGFDDAALAERVAPYGLPQDLGARIRHATGYWRWRRTLGDATRRLRATLIGRTAARRSG